MADERRQAKPSAVHRALSEVAEDASPIRRGALEKLSRFFLIASGVALFGLLFSIVLIARRPPEVVALVPPPIQTIIQLPTLTPTVTPTPLPPLVALLAGHSGGIDTGAVCPDGLREVDITTDVAHRAKALLEALGYRVDILAEFDARLSRTRQDYAPNVFLAIHADSCIYYASGYKVARADNSAIPQEDDRLTRCISLAYAAATDLPFHAGSITTDMTHYHGLEEIDPNSPGAIIELGFLGSNHDLLQNHRDILAQGVANGIDDFLKGNGCPQGQTGNQ